MGSSTEAAVLAALERAEMAARERRLAASNRAEGIVTAAREQAATISAQADGRVDEVLRALRQATEAEADAAIEALEREAEARPAPSASLGLADASVAQAVSTVVAHVLGETAPVGDEGPG